MKKVLVIGGAGYIGTSVVSKFLEEGHQVTVYDSLLFGEDSLADFKSNPKFSLIKGDIRNISEMNRAIDGRDAVILVAAVVGEPACNKNPKDTVETNIFAAISIASMCKYYNIERFVFASTDSVYGIKEGLIDENASRDPISLYAKSKVIVEDELMNMMDENFKPIILRKSTVYGLSRRMRFDLILNILAKNAAISNKIKIFGGKQWRPMVHVNDVAKAYLLAVEAPYEKVAGEIFNVGDTSQNYQIGKIGELVRKVVPDVEIEVIPQNPDLRDYHVNCDKIKKQLGFRVEYTCEQGIKEVYDAIKAGKFRNIDDKKYYNA